MLTCFATQAALDEAKDGEKTAHRRTRDAQRVLERCLNKRAMLYERKDACSGRLRQLGALPQEAFTKYKDQSACARACVLALCHAPPVFLTRRTLSLVGLKTLYAKLVATNKEAKKYTHVNKKALDQYVSFSTQREQLLERKQEQEKGHAKITELIAVLDAKKDEAIERTFKQVAKYFSDVFRELVPDGRASLVMQVAEGKERLVGWFSHERVLTLCRADAGPGVARVDRYTGVAIRVSFGGTGETRLLQQLSGGQKSLVVSGHAFGVQSRRRRTDSRARRRR